MRKHRELPGPPVQARDPGSNCTNGATVYPRLARGERLTTRRPSPRPKDPRKSSSVPNPTGGNLARTASGAPSSPRAASARTATGMPLSTSAVTTLRTARTAARTRTTTRTATTTRSRSGRAARCASSTRSSAPRAPAPVKDGYGAGDHWTNDGTGGGETSARSPSGSASTTRTGLRTTTSDDTQVGSDSGPTTPVSDARRLLGQLQQGGLASAEQHRPESPGLRDERRPQPMGAPGRLERPRRRHLPPERQHQPRPERDLRGGEPLLHLGQRRGHRARLRRGPDGRVHQPRRNGGRRRSAVLLRADRGDARRQDHGDHALRSRRGECRLIPSIPHAAGWHLSPRDIQLVLE